MAKKDRRAILARNTIIGFITVVAILIFGFGSYVSSPLSGQEDISEADDFRELENPRPRRRSDPISVVEFFAYTCIHCKNFDPMIEEWAAEQPGDVAFSRQPAMWSPIQVMLGQTYLTLADKEILAQNHTRIFRAIHDTRKQFLTPEMVGDYVDGRGLSKDEFLRAFNSPRVKTAVRDAETDVRDFNISATPSIVVAGRYVVGMKAGMGRALEVVDKLVNQIRTEDQAKG
ncbi:MAG: thioredoxin domain-containing protein [Pseudomonadales bacterium]|nr:thioredoxin domain-containing protein [Pseudomonadales bacterium]